MGKIILVAAALSLFSSSSFAACSGDIATILKEQVGLGSSITDSQGRSVNVAGSANAVTIVGGPYLFQGRITKCGQNIVSVSAKGTDPETKKPMTAVVTIKRSNGTAYASGHMGDKALNSRVN